jgi:hypothetical protein
VWFVEVWFLSVQNWLTLDCSYLSQGAKPSHGGILLAAKITQITADARGLGLVC